MKKSELVEIIRTVVREEIENSLPQFLMEVLAEKISGQSPIVENKKPQPVQVVSRKKPSVTLEAPLKMAPVAAPRLFAKDPALNAVLNETVGGIPTEQEVSGISALDTIRNLSPEVLNENKEVAAVATAMTRDYSQLVKAFDKKKRL